jgi:hypothetical protein
MTAVPVRRSYRLEIGELATTPTRVIRAPHLSLLTWLLELAAGPPLAGTRAAALAHVLSPQSRQALPALGMPGLDRLPATLSCLGDARASSVAEHAERLANSDGSGFAAEVCTLWGGRPPGPWRAVAERPRAWLRAASRAFLDAWTVGDVHYRAADLLFHREEERIGAAAVTGTLDIALATLSPRLHARNGTLELESNCEQTIGLGGRKLALVPMLVSQRKMIVDFEATKFATVAYPLPGLTAQSTLRSTNAPADRLTQLLGPIRAAVLRALSRPLSMQVLATTVHCSPSTLTYHCDQLVAAGLLRRERHGRHMLVGASERAQGLIDLLA